MKKCKKCGAVLDDSELFCDQCGERVVLEKNKLSKIIGISLGCFLVVLLIILWIIGNRPVETVVISPDELSKIIDGGSKTSEYMDKNIEMSGYLVRGEDNPNESIKLEDDEFALISSFESFMKNKFIVFEIDSDEVERVLDDAGTFSEVQLSGTLGRSDSKGIYLKAVEIQIEDEKNKTEGKKFLDRKISELEQNEDNSNDVSSKDVIKDGDVVTVDEILAEPSLYAGKTLKIKGMLPQALILSSDGREIVAINNDAADKYIEIKGGSPNFGGCAAIVYGNVILSEGTPVINAISFESLDPTYGAVAISHNDQEIEAANLNDNTSFDVSNLGSYRVNFNMVKRLYPDANSEKVGSVKAGEVVMIEDFTDLRSTNEGLWGKVGSGEWICIMDAETEYLTKAN